MSANATLRNKRHTSVLAKQDLERFLNQPVSHRKVSASTQSQTLDALVFMHREVLETEPGWVRCGAYNEKPAFPLADQ